MLGTFTVTNMATHTIVFSNKHTDQRPSKTFLLSASFPNLKQGPAMDGYPSGQCFAVNVTSTKSLYVVVFRPVSLEPF